jgi:hypothetical protein
MYISTGIIVYQHAPRAVWPSVFLGGIYGMIHPTLLHQSSLAIVSQCRLDTGKAITYSILSFHDDCERLMWVDALVNVFTDGAFVCIFLLHVGGVV